MSRSYETHNDKVVRIFKTTDFTEIYLHIIDFIRFKLFQALWKPLPIRIYNAIFAANAEGKFCEQQKNLLYVLFMSTVHI